MKMYGQLRIPGSSVDKTFSLFSNAMKEIRPLVKEESIGSFDEFAAKVDTFSIPHKRESFLFDLHPHSSVQNCHFAWENILHFPTIRNYKILALNS